MLFMTSADGGCDLVVHVDMRNETLIYKEILRDEGGGETRRKR